MFTTTPHWLEWIRADPLRLTDVSARFLAAGLALDRLVARGIERLEVPALLLLAGRDEIVDNERTAALFERAPARLRETEVVEGASHALQFDHTRWLAGRLEAFLDGRARP